jgi:hypothetical protein
MCTGGEGKTDYNVYKGGPDHNVDKIIMCVGRLGYNEL